VTDAAVAARFNVRPLLPGPQDALRDNVLRLGVAGDRLSMLATHGSSEALAVQGLTADLTRVLERVLRERGGAVLSDVNGTRAVLLAPLMVMGQLPAVLAQWSEIAEGLGAAIGTALMARGSSPPPLRAGGRVLEMSTRTLLMGIVNVTPDSFAGDGLTDTAAALRQAVEMADAGADIIDIGGESTRPNSRPVAEDEELRRVIPAVEAICAAVAVPVSIDTRKPGVARAGVAAGAVMINDVWGLRGDPAMVEVVAANPGVAVVAMHNQPDTTYVDLMETICGSLRESVTIAASHGISSDRIVVDPGFGFGKTPAQNLELMRRLGELRGLGLPVLLGPSRKHTISVVAGNVAPAGRDDGTLALLALAVAGGVSVVRVHNVVAARQAVQMADAVVRGTPPDVARLARPGPTG
jgi:dihydropteroate synthase